MQYFLCSFLANGRITGTRRASRMRQWLEISQLIFLAIHRIFVARFSQTKENVKVVRWRLSDKFKVYFISTIREPTPFLPSFLPFVISPVFHRETARSQATKTEAIPDATRASQIAFAFSSASFVPRHFSEFPTFSISVEMLVNIRERKARGLGVGRGG